MLNIRFFGAAQTTTGTAHIIEWNGHNILLDCGLYQGHRKEAFELNRKLPLPANQISAVILSHSHIDHSGNIPSLVRQGYHGPIFCTEPTEALCDIMLRDSAYLQMRDVEIVNKKRQRDGKNLFEPLYMPSDIDATMKLMKAVPYGRTFEVLPGLEATLNDAGHILGSATVTLDYKRGRDKRRLLFTGDIGQGGMPLICDPVAVPDVNALITESTYGDRAHPTHENITGRLKDYITFIHQHKSILVIPAFSVGRTQQILFYLHEMLEARMIPQTPVVVDSPLSTKASEVYAKYSRFFNATARSRLESGEDLISFPGLRFISDVEESKQLNGKPGPMIILSASGMCEGGRVLHHLKNNIENPENIVLIVGFQAENTLGRRIVDCVSPVKILGDEYRLRATVFTINALSGHADRNGLLKFAKSLGNKIDTAFCVHGEPQYCEDHAKQLRETLGIPRVEIPVRGQVFQNM